MDRAAGAHSLSSPLVFHGIGNCLDMAANEKTALLDDGIMNAHNVLPRGVLQLIRVYVKYEYLNALSYIPVATPHQDGQLTRFLFPIPLLLIATGYPTIANDCQLRKWVISKANYVQSRFLTWSIARNLARTRSASGTRIFDEIARRVS
jgi:hypothetical protein